ncbi:MAG: holo-[acyl-carrier protein] synthase [Myxococcota bacterium]|jgi:holo-[acyl-carrier protein] synthase
MIAGIGVDIVDVVGFRAQLADPASSFVHGTFTAGEQADAKQRPSRDSARHLAARYAAKEAFIKAWSGSRWDQEPVLQHIDMRDIEVVCDRHGRPKLTLHGALRRAVEMTTGASPRHHLSLSHDGEAAVAYVVLEKSV